MMKQVEAGVLEVAYLESGPGDGAPAILLHGFPYDVCCYDGGAERLANAGRRVIGPWLRGYGPMRFLRTDTPRVGQQAALGGDLLAFMDALRIERATLAALTGAAGRLASGSAATSGAPSRRAGASTRRPPPARPPQSKLRLPQRRRARRCGAGAGRAAAVGQPADHRANHRP